MSFLEITTLMKDWVVIIATLAGVIIGLQELHKWRLETLGRDKYTIVKRIGSLAQAVETQLHHVRAVHQMRPELEGVLKKILTVDEVFDKSIDPFIAKQELMTKCASLYQELRESGIEAKLLELDFDDEIAELGLIIVEMQATLSFILYSAPESEKRTQLTEAFSDILKGLRGDEYSKRIETAANLIVAKAVKTMKGKKT